MTPASPSARLGPLVRYITVDYAKSQRWAPAVLFWVVSESVALVTESALLPACATSSVLLLFVSAWLTVGLANSEDPVQAAITAAAAGGFRRLQTGRLASALLCGAAVACISMIPIAVVARSGLSGADLGGGLLAQLVSVLTGVAVGTLAAPPVVTRAAWTALATVVLCGATVVIPDAVPTRQMLTLLNGAPGAHLALTLALYAAGAAAFLVVTAGIATAVMSRRG
ncbi:MAG TPA: hypothetical protein VMB82_02080 [Acidimicrobiales bacterium]|nr:hypothetical protein [Acidimicrobiales bacterium]